MMVEKSKYVEFEWKTCLGLANYLGLPTPTDHLEKLVREAFGRLYWGLLFGSSVERLNKTIVLANSLESLGTFAWPTILDTRVGTCIGKFPW